MSNESLTLLFYLLMRDDLPLGRVEQRVMDVESTATGCSIVYSCLDLHAKARKMAERIMAAGQPKEGQ